MVWLCRKNANPKNTKIVSNAGMEGIRKRGRQRKRRRNDVEKDFNIMGEKNRHWPKIIGNGGRLYLESWAKGDCSAREG